MPYLRQSLEINKLTIFANRDSVEIAKPWSVFMLLENGSCLLVAPQPHFTETGMPAGLQNFVTDINQIERIQR